ncbi:Cold-shock DEAD-box protein A [Candidatus Palibaumannia cicadellinicola]|uniref:ATP-dependent RNA helicase DeaD n=2 Tax=Candidatus Palibaumannia cicadellinicola TaxID=186490 RepID=A0A0K2BM73_9GAMM|nr:Cold-shock DEAD-box protein A [Candidatus Baumannia cicadellinicola]
MSVVNISFAKMGLNTFILDALTELGYETPSPIQAECIPYLLAGRDLLGIAQTGSGKTAAFALPFIHNINLQLNAPQILVIVPTRELAVQVGEACSYFAKYIKSVKVVTLYGGQRYDVQLRFLKQGSQVVVGTPGRLLDHLKRGTLDLSNLKSLVLDEADEMLRMGFIEDVENILAQIPAKHQTALFSATMPEVIRRITRRFMNNPKEVNIKSSISNRPDIHQSYWTVHGRCKNEALVRFLEAEDFDAAIIFVRTKNATLEVSQSLEKHGYNSAALNGDMNQMLREQTLNRLKKGSIDILIATDVAARGLDVDRISLVINYDIPMDSESYIHRIGRTGRAGRAGRALLFVENRERRLLRNIERLMKLTIPEVKLPTAELLSTRRLAKFAEKLKHQLTNIDMINLYRKMLVRLQQDENLDLETIAAVLLKMAQGKRPLIISQDNNIIENKQRSYLHGRRYANNIDYSEMDLYRIEVGRNDGVEVRHIVGAIANQVDINSNYIGNIRLFASHSTIELPKGITCDMLSTFTRTRIMNKPINIQLFGEAPVRCIERNNSSSMRRNLHSRRAVSGNVGRERRLVRHSSSIKRNNDNYDSNH